MSKEEFLKIQTCVLKVNIHCDGCKDKVKKILQKIEGVYTTKIDAEHGKVTVSGNIEPSKLIKKLVKNGKHAELWGASKGGQNHPHPHNLFKNVQIENAKGKGSGQQQPKGGQQMKGFQDLKTMMPFGGNKGGQGGGKAVKFNMPPEYDGMSDGEYSDDFDDYDDEFDDEEGFSDEDDDDGGMDEAHLNRMKALMGNGGGGGGGLPQMPNLLMMQNMMKNGAGGAGGGGNNGGNAKKGSGGSSGGANMNNGGTNGGKKGGNGNANGGGNQNQNQAGGKGAKNGNKNGNNPGGAKKGGNMMAPAGTHMGKNPAMGQLSNLAAVQGLPAAGGPTPASAYFQPGPGPNQMPGNPYQQQQLAAMMMNQQRANGNERFQPMMYARPPPAVNYIPPYPAYPPYPYPPPPGTRLDDYSMFSDENTSSCTIM